MIRMVLTAAVALPRSLAPGDGLKRLGASDWLSSQLLPVWAVAVSAPGYATDGAACFFGEGNGMARAMG
jgi:hypothetical protein